jgi:enoyl-CoA hydratase
LAKVIEAVNACFEAGVDGFEAELKAFGDCCGTDDFREGATAFLEKRAPKFAGR